MEIKKIPVSQLVPHTIRTDEGTREAAVELRSLVENIRLEGIQTPLAVCKFDDGKYHIASGNRRFQAGLELGFTEFDCRVFPKEQFDEIRISSNLHREELSPSLRAKYVKLIMKKTNNLKEISAITGIPYDKIRKETYVERLIEPLQVLIDKGILTVRAGAYIAPLTKEGQKRVHESIRYLVDDSKEKPKSLSRNIISLFVKELPAKYFKTKEKKHQLEGPEAETRRRAKRTLEVTLDELEENLNIANMDSKELRNRIREIFSFYKKCLRKDEVSQYIQKGFSDEHATIKEIAKLESIPLD